MSLFPVFRKEWMEALRSYRLLIVAIVLIFFGLTSPLVAKLTPQIVGAVAPMGGDLSRLIPTPTVKDAIAQYIKNMAQFSLILALLLGMGAVAQEKDKGTAAMMLVKPLPRGTFLLAKFLGLAVIFAIAIAIAGIGSYYYTMLLFEPMNILHWLVLNLLLFQYVLVIIAITLFCSTVTKSQSAAGGIAVGLMIIGFIMGAIRNFGTYLPGALNSWGGRLMLGDTQPSGIALGVSVGIIVLSLVAAWLVFKRQEL